jgi:AbrB family looped-hinge helix DNA binding protein
MTYTTSVNSRGTFTIPKKLRDELKIETGSKILIVKRGDNYIFRVVPKLSKLAGSFKTTKKLSDEDLNKLASQAFVRAKNIY